MTVKSGWIQYKNRIGIIDKINIPIGTLNPLLKIYATTFCNPDFCDTDFGTLLDTEFNAVSYTHLDVYKRQEFNVSDKLGLII